MFKPAPSRPDFVAMEHEVLRWWEEERLFDRLRRRNAGGPAFSFIDGPITANNPMGVHHAWGRTYKDIYQRFKAMDGYDQRFQNGFDCQGLWVEVEVEKELQLGSKREIRAFGLDRFARRCRERVEKYAAVQTRQSQRLGQWMDWEHSYYTMSDTNIEYIWHFLQRCHEKGWLYQGRRVMPWCSRCGTSLSQHELTDAYKDVEHTAVIIVLPFLDQPDEAILVWTTTPWTLPANVAVAVDPAATYVRVRQDVPGARALWLAAAALPCLKGNYEVLNERQGEALVGRLYRTPFADLAAQREVAHRVVPWALVDPAEGAGAVHIAPGCGAEDFELGRQLDLATLCPIDDDGVYVDGYGFLTGRNACAAGKAIIAYLQNEGLLYDAAPYAHRYPHCWRCGEELLFRLETEWFIASAEIRPRLQAAARSVVWQPEHAGKMMLDWLANMDDWCISRKRFWGLPLPFYPCECGHLTIVGSRAELTRLSGSHLAAGELHRPWIDAVHIVCPVCGRPVARVPEVGDCWLDAGIVPFSTLRYLDDRAYWERWFPADLVIEMREQIRLWFYSMLFMSVALVGRAPYRRVLVYEKVHDEQGRPMHKSWGNAIWFDEAAERMGADVMRWVYAAHPLHANLNFGYSIADETRRKLLTLWNVYSFFVTYADVDQWSPPVDAAPRGGRQDEPAGLLDRWLAARRRSYAQVVRAAMEAYDVQEALREHERFIDDLSNWYLRRSRRRFWKNDNDADKQDAYLSLYQALLTVVRLLAPVLPFLTEVIYRNLAGGAPDEPQSVHLTAFPSEAASTDDRALLALMDSVRAVTNLGLAARNRAQVRVRQPLQELAVAGAEFPADPEVLELIRDELNVKEISICSPGDSRLQEQPGWVVETAGDLGVALAVTISPALAREGLARDLVRRIQQMRKENGFAVTDRIVLAVGGDPAMLAAVAAHENYIKEETLASELRAAAAGSSSGAKVTVAGNTAFIQIQLAPAGTA